MAAPLKYIKSPHESAVEYVGVCTDGEPAASPICPELARTRLLCTGCEVSMQACVAFAGKPS